MLILIKGAGDIATGIAVRLKNAGMQVVMTEIAIPTTVRRSVAFSRAVYEGSAVVENITAKLVLDFAQIPAVLQQDEIPVLIDPRCEVLKSIHFDAVVDSSWQRKTSPPTLHRLLWSLESVLDSQSRRIATVSLRRSADMTWDVVSIRGVLPKILVSPERSAGILSSVCCVLPVTESSIQFLQSATLSKQDKPLRWSMTSR